MHLLDYIDRNEIKVLSDRMHFPAQPSFRCERAKKILFIFISLLQWAHSYQLYGFDNITNITINTVSTLLKNDCSYRETQAKTLAKLEIPWGSVVMLG